MIKKVVVDSCINIPFQYLNKSQYYDIINMLTFSQTDYMTGEKITNKFYKESLFTLHTPRFFPIKTYQFEIEEKTTIGKDINIESSITPRDSIQESAIQCLIDNYHGILKLPPGKGKTIIAIKVISEIKKKALIFVDSEKLMNQWIERIKSTTNYKEEDIGIIQGDTWNLDKDIVIAMVQTVSSRTEKDFLKIKQLMYDANFGITIIDEVHAIVGPDRFTNCAMVSSSKRIYGLSATPSRTDNRDILLNYCIGEIIFSDSTYEIQPKVNIVYFDSRLRTSKTNKYICFDDKFNKMRYVKMLRKNYSYINTVLDIVRFCLSNKRNIVLMSDIKIILDFFQKKFKEEFNIETGYFVGGSEKEEMLKQVVLTTYKLTSKAIDNPKWDTLIMLTPVASPITVEQCIGRITRKYKDKTSAVVFDLVDVSYPITLKWSKQRMQLYNKLGFEYKEIWK